MRIMKGILIQTRCSNPEHHTRHQRSFALRLSIFCCFAGLSRRTTPTVDIERGLNGYVRV